MRYISVFTAISFTFFCASCAVNTAFDDGDYRPVGDQGPRNPQVKLSESPVINDSMGMFGEVSESIPTNERGLPLDGSVLSTSPPINRVIRYGNPRLVELVAKTADIHCNPRRVHLSEKTESFWKNSDQALIQCIYSFPELCGGKTFAVLRYGKRKVLAFWEEDSQRYVLDTLTGNHKALPGVWDKDDYVGSDTNNLGYFLDEGFQQGSPAKKTFFNIGWVIKASLADEETLGKRYHKAIDESAACF